MCKPRLTYGKLHTFHLKNPTHKQLISSVEYHVTFRHTIADYWIF